MVAVDQIVLFDAFEHLKAGPEKQSLPVTGTVYEVNYSHKVFHVFYKVQGQALRTSFNFSDIGSKVKVVSENGCI